MGIRLSYDYVKEQEGAGMSTKNLQEAVIDMGVMMSALQM